MYLLLLLLLLLLHSIIYLFLFIINFTRRRVENRDSRLVTEKIWYVCMYYYSTAFPFLRINDCDFHLL